MTMAESSDERRPVVAVVSAEDGRDDASRATLLELSTAGFDVVLVAAGDGARPERTSWGEARIERVPVRWAGRTEWQQARARRRSWRPGSAAMSDDAAARARLRARELAAPSSSRPGWRSADVAARRAVLDARRFTLRAAGKATRLGWRAVDALPSRLWAGHEAALREDDLELAFGPLLDRLACDAIVADDVTAGVAARAAARATAGGRRVPWLLDARRRTASGPASRYARWATAVVGVDGTEPSLADALARALGVAPQARPAQRPPVVELPWLPPRGDAAHPLLGIGPANMAGQAWAWAKALERAHPEVGTEVIMVDRGGPLIFPADVTVPTSTYGRDVAWQESTRERILSTWTHALLEAGRPIMGVLNGRTFAADAALMQQAGLTVGLVFHGSELRDPRRHAASHRWSPFRDVDDEWVQRVQATVDLVRPDVDAFDGPCLVSTPDLLEDLPRATWLPVVVDTATWSPRAARPVREVPVVVHTPSRAAIKGSDHVDAGVQPLADAGLVEYRRIEGVPPEQMPQVLAEADVVLDQFTLGSYGVLACQAMALGVAVVGHVSEGVRSVVGEAAGMPLPLIEADPDTLSEVVRGLVADPGRVAAAADAGPAFVAAVHDGRRSAQVLVETLGLPVE